MIRECLICLETFDATNPATKYCSDECAYIAAKLRLAAARRMGREEAIRHYREYYNDPLRAVGKSKYFPILRHILRFCEEHHRTVFTCAEIQEGAPAPIYPRTLGTIAARHQQIVRIQHVGHGKNNPSLWQLTIPPLPTYR